MNKISVIVALVFISTYLTTEVVKAQSTTSAEVAPSTVENNSVVPTTPETTRSDNRTEIREDRAANRTERQEEREINRAERQEIRQERQAELTEVRQQRVINLAANVSNRFDATISRLFKIVERLESRLIKLESNGADISGAQASLRQASANLTEARSLMLTIDTEVNAATTSNNPRAAWQAVKARYQQVAELIRSAHANLRQAVAQIKTPSSAAPIRQIPDPSQPSTPDINQPTLSE